MHNNIILYCDVVTRFWAGGRILRLFGYFTGIMIQDTRGQIRTHTVGTLPASARRESG